MSRERNLPRKAATWAGESPKPKLGNLITHHTTAHPSWSLDGDEEEGKESSTPIEPKHGVSQKQVDLMTQWLKDVGIDCDAMPSRKNFLYHFAAWLLEEDLPWTTGEAPSLKRLFKWLQIKYELPSDTTVRNVVAELYALLHGEVVKALAVSNLFP
jgi:hypothetical protein